MRCFLTTIVQYLTLLYRAQCSKHCQKLQRPAENVEEAKGFHVQNGDLEFNLFPGRINSTLACSPVSSSTHCFSKHCDSLDRSLFLRVEKSELLKRNLRNCKNIVEAGSRQQQQQVLQYARISTWCAGGRRHSAPWLRNALKSLVTIACCVHY